MRSEPEARPAEGKLLRNERQDDQEKYAARHNPG